MEFFGKLSEELTDAFVRPHLNFGEPIEQESFGVDFHAFESDEEDEVLEETYEVPETDDIHACVSLLFPGIKNKDLSTIKEKKEKELVFEETGLLY
eukprot:GHVP01010888.1.p1 GENE.GHVP01010888.1~~GHVP01010888.1.p1  ORF type:complete len:107 (+),score=33.05 GHVP01010888.1:35-322(+)